MIPPEPTRIVDVPWQLAKAADRPFLTSAETSSRRGTLHQIIPFTNTPLFLTGVVPSSSTVSTAQELSRFAELLRRGGELDGVRVLAPETLHQATRECRRLRPDLATGLMPLRWGTGYATGRYGGWAGAYAFWTANHWW